MNPAPKAPPSSLNSRPWKARSMRYMEQKIKLLLVDDHSLFREGLMRLLEAEQGLELGGGFASITEALDAIGRDSIDVGLLDFDLGEQQGMQFLTTARARGF